jgi:hypothetical protein
LIPVARFKQAQKEFIQVAGLADFDPKAKVRSAELREAMTRASQEIAKDPARMRAAEREGFAPQVRNFVRQAEREQGRERAGGSRRTMGLKGSLYENIQREVIRCGHKELLWVNGAGGVVAPIQTSDISFLCSFGLFRGPDDRSERAVSSPSIRTRVKKTNSHEGFGIIC